jgi:cytochrome P450
MRYPRPPGPTTRLPGGHGWAFARDPLGFLQSLAHMYGDIVYFRLGVKEVYFFNHPDFVRELLVNHYQFFPKGTGVFIAQKLLGQGLLTSGGDLHRRQRRLMQPFFHHQHMARYGDTITAYGERLREQWRDGATVDVAQEMMRVSLAIIARTLFGAAVEGQVEEIRKAMRTITALFPRFILPFPELLWALPLPGNFRFRRARRFLDTLIYGVIDAQRCGKASGGELLAQFGHAQGPHAKNEGMTAQQLRDEAMTLLLAGHETIANAMTWCWYLLSQYPEAEARLHTEVDAVLAGRLPTVEDIPRLHYTEMVVAETMRLYPPIWTVTRRASQDYKIGDYVVPAGASVRVSQFVMHRDGRFFPAPETFEPQRWTPEARAARPRFAYFPFGAGPRQCIGEAFARMQGILLLATLASRWRLRLAPGQQVRMRPHVTLRPKYGMRMLLARRQ